MKLSTILGEPGASGVYLVQGPPRKADIQKWCKEHDLALYRLNDKTIRSKDQFLEYCAKVFKFPDYFGRNWDALEECLIDMDWVDAKGFVILFEQFKAFVEKDPDEFDEALDVFKDAADHWRDEDTFFVTLLLGDVPTPQDLEIIEI